ILNQSGQKLVIIRNPNPTREDYDTAWTLSVLSGLIIGVCVLIASFPAEAYFHDARAVPVMQCLALRSVIGGLENIGTTDFRRDLNFYRFFLYNVYTKAVAFVVTLVLAFALRNYWALVGGILTSQLTMTTLSYIMHPFRPRLSLAKFNDFKSF